MNGTARKVMFCGRMAKARPAATPAARRSSVRTPLTRRSAPPSPRFAERVSSAGARRIDASTTSAHAAALGAWAINASRVEYHRSDEPNQTPIVAIVAAPMLNRRRAAA